ncbi:HEAT repeat domain-containing protein [Kitasatospora sp. NPDC048365]|uniref:HEAT repeat domain-containing protein n=1 Tax=Kitasatospora sp. NPDC048365 TaxID=3364050 RepID=UPI00372477CE
MNTAQLVQRALTSPPDDRDALLQEAADDGEAALPLAIALTASADTGERATGCDLLGRTADLHPELRTAATAALLAAAAGESDPEVLADLARALGCTEDARATSVLCALAAHPDAGVRQETAVALGTCPPVEPVVAALIALTGDEVPDVRNWATFTLGFQLPADGPAIRAALRGRLTDPHQETREEAVRGLARRRDPDAVPLLAELLRDEDGAHTLTFTAARILGDPELLPALRQYDPADPGVTEALRACDPSVQEQLLSAAWQVLTTLDRIRPDLDAGLTVDRFDQGLTLSLPDDLTCDVEALLARAEQDPDRAARLVDTDLPRS